MLERKKDISKKSKENLGSISLVLEVDKSGHILNTNYISVCFTTRLDSENLLSEKYDKL